jgi:hypothetical protein
MAYTKDCDGRRTKDQATKTLICTFSGAAFVSEIEDGNLNIYLISDSDSNVSTGANVIGIADAAKGPMSAARMQRLNEQRRKTNPTR